jgi:hypothetical protein
MIPSSSSRRPQKQVADPASMQMEAYEHEDSDSDDVDNAKLPHHKKKKKAAAATTAANFAGALSSWAMGGGDAGTSTSTHPPSSSSSSALEGFVLGSTAGSTKPKLYRGPDVPREWHIVPHAFGPHEHPSILKAIAHATKLAVAQELRAQSLAEALQAATVAARVTTTTTTAAASRPQEQQEQSVDSSRRSIFAGIGEQMMNRFTAAASTTDNSNDITTTTTTNNNNNNDDPSQPQEEGTMRNDTASLSSSSPHPSTVDMAITRTVKPFVPEPLLCKRLNVSGPKPLAGGDATSIPAIAPRRDEVFFQTQVIGAVAEETRKRGAETSSTTALLLLNNNDDDDEEADQPQRPPLNVYKSIFDPDIANADDIESEANDDKEPETSAIASGDVNNAAIVPYQDVVTNNNSPSPSLLPHTNATLVPFSNQKCDPDDRSQSSASSSSSTEQRRQHRKRKHEKKSSKTKKAKKHHKKKSKKR